MNSLLLVTSILVPAMTAAGVVVLGFWLLPAQWRAVSGALGIALGFAVAYGLLSDSSLWPKAHWNWLPYLGLVGALAALSLADDVPRPARWGSCGLLGLAIAPLLVPTWPALLPLRPVWIGLAAAYFAVLGVLLVELPAARIAPRLLVWLAGSAIGTTLIVGIGVSMRYGEASIAVAPAILGCLVGILGTQRLGFTAAEDAAPLVRGAIPVYLALAAGTGFVGCIERQPELLWAAALAPAAPLVLWLVSLIPDNPKARWRTPLIELGAVLAVVVPLVLWSAWDLLTGDGY